MKGKEKRMGGRIKERERAKLEEGRRLGEQKKGGERRG